MHPNRLHLCQQTTPNHDVHKKNQTTYNRFCRNLSIILLLVLQENLGIFLNLAENYLLDRFHLHDKDEVHQLEIRDDTNQLRNDIIRFLILLVEMLVKVQPVNRGQKVY